MAYEKQAQVCLTSEQEPGIENWQARVQGLQEVVCFLLLKNQEMRMAMLVKEETTDSESSCRPRPV